MPSKKPANRKSHVTTERPPFERIVLLLQGGGALGAYQAGVYQALDEANLAPEWVAGISIGAINAALIAGNPPEQRVARLREFWEGLGQSTGGIAHPGAMAPHGEAAHSFVNQLRAAGTVLFGVSGFFSPRFPPPIAEPRGSIEATSYYDTAPLKATLERLVDFDRINAGETRLSVGAVNIRSGNFVYFDTVSHRITSRHVMASGSLPPGLPATEIEGEYYWDGGIVSNTPLEWVLDSVPRRDTLAFQVDLWCSRGELPRDLIESAVREKEIRFSSRTRAATDRFRRAQMLRHAVAHAVKTAPPEFHHRPEAEFILGEADETVFNIVELIYRARKYEGASKDYEFSRATMEEHWTAGYNDTVRTLRHPEVLQRPTGLDGVFTFDLAIQGRE